MLYGQSESYVVDQVEGAYEIRAHFEDDLHEIRTRVVFDYETYCIKEAEVTGIRLPFPVCQQAMDKMQQLVGVQAGPGFARRVKEIVGGAQGCTHLVEMVSKSMKNALYGSSRSIPEWADPEDYKQRWSGWEVVFHGSCLYFSQPDALKGMLEKVHNKEIGIVVGE
ncbi:MAG: DUF2889 domain-containing protein [Syntrophomonadaceae bacterium]|nr:DUF2889 domain-containing protein [Syntrophomonadaceae bacterium]